MRIKQTVLTVLLISSATTVLAQSPGEAGPMGGLPPMRQNGGGGGMPPVPFGKQFDPMKENLYPPEMVMQNQRALALTDSQKTAVKETMLKSMTKFTELMWQQSAEQENMELLLKQERLDEAKVLAQLDKLLGVEDDMKRAMFGSLLKVRNILTPAQLAKLRAIRQTMTSPHQHGGKGEKQSERQSESEPGK